MLFEPPVPATIVASSGSGILQHNAFTWQIEGNTFIRKKELSPECIEYKKIFDEWIESADMEDRETFTEDFFDALRAGKAETLDDIAKSGLGGFGTILYSLVNVESQTKIVLGKLLKQVATHVRQLRPNDILTTRTGIAGISMLFPCCVWALSSLFYRTPPTTSSGIQLPSVRFHGLPGVYSVFAEKKCPPRNGRQRFCSSWRRFWS